MTDSGMSDYIRECNVRWGMLAEALGARGIALVEDGGFTYARKATRAQSAVSVYLYAPSTSDWGRGRPDFEIEVSPSHDRRQTFKPGKEGFNWQKIADKIERVRLRYPEEVEKQFCLRSSGAEMHIGNEDGPIAPRRLRVNIHRTLRT